MASISQMVEIRGPWSLAVSRRFWEGFTPNRLPDQTGNALVATFLSEADWQPVHVSIEQTGGAAHLHLTGDGDLDAAAGQVARFMAINIDGSRWPEIAAADPVIAGVQQALPGFRPCGFYSPYEAAAWTVLSQRIRMTQAGAIRQRLTTQLGRDGAFPPPAVLRANPAGLPGRKDEYLAAVCDAALDGVFDGVALQTMDADEAIARVQQIKGLGPFAAGLVVVRGANHPDALPQQEPRLEREVERRYGAGTRLSDVGLGWRPYRTWAAVSLRALADTDAGMPGAD